MNAFSKICEKNIATELNQQDRFIGKPSKL